MIAKKIARKASRDDFRRLAEYVSAIKDMTDPQTWGRTTDYILDVAGSGERVLGMSVTNCDAEDVFLAVAEIEATQDLNTRAEKDKSYHLVFSFPEGERPTIQQLHEMEQALCDAIGLGDHQRISAIHDDTKNLHVHVAINKVHPESLKCISPFNDHKRLMEACVELEQKFGLTPTNHGVRPERLRQGARDMEAQSLRQSLQGWLREHADDLLMIAQQARSWQDLHEGMARFGLTLKPRGSGFIIQANGTAARVKASDVDKAFAHKALTTRFGDYQQPGPEVAAIIPSTVYVAEPTAAPTGKEAPDVLQEPGDRQQQDSAGQAHHPDMDKGRPGAERRLFEEYLKERQEAERARDVALADLKRTWDSYSAQLGAYHAKAAAGLRAMRFPHPQDRKVARAAFAHERRDDWDKTNTNRREATKAMREKHRPISWREFLQKRADAGDELALGALRKQARRQELHRDDVLWAKDAASARHILFAELKPRTDRYGRVHYGLADGGRISDRGDALKVTEVSAQAAFLALSLAREKFGEQPLRVGGSEELKRALIEAAAMPGLEVTFEDPAMEEARARRATERAAEYAARRTLADDYVDDRNDQRGRTADVLEHRRWTRADAGPVEYCGRRQFADGSGALLWRTGDTMLVQACSAAQYRRAHYWKLGDAFEVNKSGQQKRAEPNTERGPEPGR